MINKSHQLSPGLAFPANCQQ